MNVMQRFEDLYPSAAECEDSSTLFYHRLVETFKFGFAQRMHLGDPRFEELAVQVAKNLTSDSFVRQIRDKIDDKKTYPSDSGHYDNSQAFLHEDHGTAHVSVVDGEGNAVSVTTTVNG
jgi:gamma-glutamyltranspeptidase/glutathione hydrolase/leukotriene-C4 hydrolase